MEKEKYYVMYWNDREDYPVAVFEVMAEDIRKAEEIAYENGGNLYEDDWPLLSYSAEDDMAPTDEAIARYKKNVFTDYYDLTKKGNK